MWHYGVEKLGEFECCDWVRLFGLFEGDIDEVRVFDYARTDSAIQADMNQTYCKIPKGLVAYYRLNDGDAGKTNTSKTTAKDHSGSSNNGKLSGFSLTGSSSNWISGSSSITGGDTKASIDTTVCDLYVTPKGNKVTSTTKLTETLTNSSGCDSIISISVTVGRNYYFTRHETCDSFVSDQGRVYYQSGTYRDTLFKANALGCDSIRIMEAVVHQKEQSQSKEKACDSTEILGTWYFKSANIQNTYSNRFGCDSTHYISLEVNYASSFTIQDEVCDRYTSDLGNVYTKTGVYKEKLSKANQYGCDSIVWLDLIIHQKSRTTVNIDDCDTFISPTGKAYVQNGVYEEKFTSQYGCDSVMVYDVRLENREYGSDILQGCDSIQVGNMWYTTNDTVEYTWTNRNGCDSIVTYRLFVTTVNNDVDVSKHQITAKQLGAKYQWVDCKTGDNIAGETNRTYRPDNSGEYAVDITYNKCTTRSACMSVIGLSLGETQANRTAVIYPNPNQHAFTFTIPEGVHATTLSVFTIDGKLVLDKTLNINDSNTISHDLKSGYYQVVLQTEKGPYIGKMMVQ